MMNTLFSLDCFADSQDEIDSNITITPQSCSLDATMSESFKQEAMQRIGSCGSPHIVIDMQKVTLVDCSGLGSLLYILRQVTAIGGEATLKGVSEVIREQLARTRIDKLFKIIEGDSDMGSCAERDVEAVVVY